MHRPFFFCSMVVPVYSLVLVLSLSRLIVGGAFPLTSPHPPSGQVKQKHGRTRPHCHPLPLVNLIHAHRSLACALHRPLGSAEMGKAGNAYVVAARYCSQQQCILFIAATSRRRHKPSTPSPSRHRCRVRVVRVNKKPMPDNTPALAFSLPHTTLKVRLGRCGLQTSLSSVTMTPLLPYFVFCCR